MRGGQVATRFCLLVWCLSSGLCGRDCLAILVVRGAERRVK